MRLPSLFRRTPSGRATDRAPTDAPLSPDETVAVLRTRARRRLIGATVLVAAAVVALPWLFESQPRPLPPDLAVELAGKEAPVPVAKDTAPQVAPPASSPMQRPSVSDGPVSRTEAASTPAPATVPAPAARVSHAAAPPPPTTTAALPDATRARALLDGKATIASPPSAPAGVRYIVQLGAYAEADAVATARSKAERLGLKTYTQVVEAPAGRRTRVRVGPYASKAEADHAVSQLRSAGLAAVVLTLGD